MTEAETTNVVGTYTISEDSGSPTSVMPSGKGLAPVVSRQPLRLKDLSDRLDRNFARLRDMIQELDVDYRTILDDLMCIYELVYVCRQLDLQWL